MLETTQQVAAGWYPDPLGGLWLRRWDGASWTHETQGGGPSADNLEYVDSLAKLRLRPQTPETGWAGVAFALHSAMVSREPVAVTVAVQGHGSIVVNTLEHTYSWAQETAELPFASAETSVSFMRAELAGAPQARNLDGLLWRISQAAFPHRLAPWLQEGDLYRMQRWPNLTTINPELDDMRQAAMLANGMFTVEELAGFSDRSYQPTRSLINALSLMDTLKIAVPRDTGLLAVHQQQAAAPVAPAQPKQKPGLFQRLRAKLGL